MTGDVCLSRRDIERYLREEESRVHALRGDVEFGSTNAVIGASACGKSTLYILDLLDEADSGFVPIASEHVSDLPEEEWAAGAIS